MTTCNVGMLRQRYENSPEDALRMSKCIPGIMMGFREDIVQKWLDQKKAADLNHHLTKTTRPWDIVNLTGELDPKQPWVGVEYETGYATKEQYQAVINHVWFNMPFTAIDHEGCGRFPVEITFPPRNIEEVMSDDYRMDNLLTFMQTNAPKAKHRGQVGTHVNISTPSYRALKETVYNGAKPTKHSPYKVTRGLNIILRTLSSHDQRRFFGRIPYGLGYDRASNDGQRWIELKLFDSMGDLATWRSYKKTIAKLAELIEFYAANHDAMPNQYYDAGGKRVIEYGSDEWRACDKFMKPHESNLADFLEGKIEAKDIIVKYKLGDKYAWHDEGHGDPDDDDDDYYDDDE